MGRSQWIPDAWLVLLCAACFVPVGVCRGVAAAEPDEPVEVPVEKLIAKLKSSDASVRKAAAEALVKVGAAAVEPLAAARKNAEQPLRESIDAVLAKIGAVPWPPREPRCTLKSDPSQEYYVYVPRDFDPKKTYWVLVAVHGLGGNGQGALGFAGFADELQCVVAGPSFKGTYQQPEQGAGKVMREIFDAIRRACKVHPKMYLTGFSAGAQFVHRFALQNPELAVGCAAHSAGSWGSGNKEARDVPFLVTCGEADTERIEPAKRFAQSLQEMKYRSVVTAWFPGVGHSMCQQVPQLTKEHYWTAVTGLNADERKQAEDDLGSAGRLIGESKYKDAARLLNRIAAFPQKSPFTDRADAALERIRKAAADKLAAVEKEPQADPRASVAALEQLREEFDGTPGADLVTRALRALEKRPDVLAGREKEKNAAAASQLYDAAEKLLAEKRYASALEKLKAAARYAGTPAGIKAAAKTKELEADPAVLRTLRAEDCRTSLSLARNFCSNNMREKARPLLEKVVQTCPGSPEADEASALLKDMK